MKLSTILLATLACTQAICIEANADSQVDAEFFDDLINWPSGAVAPPDFMGDGFEDAFSYDIGRPVLTWDPSDHWNDHITEPEEELGC